MNLSLKRDCLEAVCNTDGNLSNPPKYVIKRTLFRISAHEITTTEDIDTIIRQLQQIRSEIADGCTKSIIQPIASLNQIEKGSHTLDR